VILLCWQRCCAFMCRAFIVSMLHQSPTKPLTRYASTLSTPVQHKIRPGMPDRKLPERDQMARP
jgi:hypothetical protein